MLLLPTLGSDCLHTGRRDPGRIDPDSALAAREVRRHDVVFDEGLDRKDEVPQMFFAVYLHHEQYDAVGSVEGADGPGIGTAPQRDELAPVGGRRLGGSIDGGKAVDGQRVSAVFSTLGLGNRCGPAKSVGVHRHP